MRSTGDASHDAPVAFLEDLVFRGPTLQQAWDIASLRPTVLLHLKERSPRCLRAVHAFPASHPLRRVIALTIGFTTGLAWAVRGRTIATRLKRHGRRHPDDCVEPAANRPGCAPPHLRFIMGR